MTHVACRLTAKNRDQFRNPTLGNRVWATLLVTHGFNRDEHSAYAPLRGMTHYPRVCLYGCVVVQTVLGREAAAASLRLPGGARRVRRLDGRRRRPGADGGVGWHDVVQGEAVERDRLPVDDQHAAVVVVMVVVVVVLRQAMVKAAGRRSTRRGDGGQRCAVVVVEVLRQAVVVGVVRDRPWWW